MGLAFRVAALAAAGAYLWWCASGGPRGGGAYDALTKRIDNVSRIVGAHEVDVLRRALLSLAASPSVERRNALLNVAAGWCLRKTDTARGDDALVELARLVDAWSLTYMTPDVTDHDAPRPHDPRKAGTTFELYA